MEYWVCVCAARLVESKIVFGDEIELWEVKKVEMAAYVVGHVAVGIIEL